MVESTGLENRQTCKRFVGSNPTLSAGIVKNQSGIVKMNFKCDVPEKSRKILERVLKNAKAKKTRVSAEITLEDGQIFYGCNYKIK